MTNKEVITLLEKEVKCVKKADKDNFNRECLNCELIQDTKTILEAFNMAISALEKQIKNENLKCDLCNGKVIGDVCGECDMYPCDDEICNKCDKFLMYHLQDLYNKLKLNRQMNYCFICGSKIRLE